MNFYRKNAVDFGFNALVFDEMMACLLSRTLGTGRWFCSALVSFCRDFLRISLQILLSIILKMKIKKLVVESF
jgi:hypothetical protein